MKWKHTRKNIKFCYSSWECVVLVSRSLNLSRKAGIKFCNKLRKIYKEKSRILKNKEMTQVFDIVKEIVESIAC